MKIDWELIAAPFVIFLKFIAGIFRSRFGIFAVIILVVVFIVLPRINPAEPPTGAAAEPYNQKLPSISAAPTIIETSSRVYYVKTYDDDGKVLTMTTFFYWDKDRWVKNKLPLPIDRGVYGYIRVTPRTN